MVLILKILQVTTFFTDHGGVEKAVSDLSHALADGHDVDVLCTKKGSTSNEAVRNLTVTSVGGTISLQGRPLAMGFPSELSKKHADVVHYHLPCPIAVLSSPISRPRAQVRVATWHHDLVRHKAFNTFMQPMLDRFLSGLDRIIVTAPQLIESVKLLKRYQHKCEVIPLGICDRDILDVDPGEVLKLREKFAGKPLLLFVGRLVYYKGCNVLLQAMRQVPDAQLVMVGMGPLHDSLSQAIDEYGLSDRVHLLGRQSDEALRALFHACDIFVLPSTLETECFALVQVEAMLCAKPVINTSLPTGVPWVSINAETGLTVPPGDVASLAQAINLLVNDEPLRRRLGEAGRRRAYQMFTLDKHVDDTVRLYEKLLTRQRAAASAAAIR